MDRREKSQHAEQKEASKDLRQANENVRKSQGDDATGSADPKKSGNRPAVDRDR